MGCGRSKTPSIEVDLPALTNDQQKSLNQMKSHKLILPRYTKTGSLIPNVTRDCKPRIQLTWITIQRGFEPGFGAHPFTYILFKHRNIYLVHFVGLDRSEIAAASKQGKTTSQYPGPHECAMFMEHQQMMKKVIGFCLLSASRLQEFDDIKHALRRLGSWHAEKGVTAEELNCFTPSFIWFLEQNNNNIPKDIREVWVKLISYIVFHMAAGLNSRNSRLRYIDHPNDNILGEDSTCRTCLKCHCLFATEAEDVTKESLRRLAKHIQQNSD